MLPLPAIVATLLRAALDQPRPSRQLVAATNKLLDLTQHDLRLRPTPKRPTQEAA